MKSAALAPLVLTAVLAGGAGYFAATQLQSVPAALAAAVASGERAAALASVVVARQGGMGPMTP